MIGFKVEVSEYMVGSKTAVKRGNTVYVSPAMWDLLSHADEREMEQLMRAIKLIELPVTDPFEMPLTF